MNKKLFIVLEGIDSSGKSTQAQLLKNYFISQGAGAILSPEPSGGVIGNLIRQALKGRVLFTQNSHHFDQQMAYLFAADRYDHLYNDFDGVFKLVESGFHVITTRYYFSSLAYNCDTEEQYDLVSRINQNFPPPDLVIYFDLPVEICLKRINARSPSEIYETKQKLTQVRANYQKIFGQYSHPLLIADATKNIDDTHSTIINFIADYQQQNP